MDDHGGLDRCDLQVDPVALGDGDGSTGGAGRLDASPIGISAVAFVTLHHVKATFSSAFVTTNYSVIATAHSDADPTVRAVGFPYAHDGADNRNVGDVTLKFELTDATGEADMSTQPWRISLTAIGV